MYLTIADLSPLFDTNPPALFTESNCLIFGYPKYLQSPLSPISQAVSTFCVKIVAS